MSVKSKGSRQADQGEGGKISIRHKDKAGEEDADSNVSKFAMLEKGSLSRIDDVL